MTQISGFALICFLLPRFSPGYERTENMFYLFYKILTKIRDSQSYCSCHSLVYSAMKALVDQSKITHYPNYFTIVHKYVFCLLSKFLIFVFLLTYWFSFFLSVAVRPPGTRGRFLVYLFFKEFQTSFWWFYMKRNTIHYIFKVYKNSVFAYV